MYSMRRGVVPFSVKSAAVAMRFSGGSPTHHDHSNSFSRPLQPEEQSAFKAQIANRPVNSFVPGKVFMRHWIAAEQSTVSIVNRVLSILVTCGLIAYMQAYFKMGFNGMSALHSAVLVFLFNWLVLHTHLLWLYPVGLGAYAVNLILN
jgi:hypothetical protein